MINYLSSLFTDHTLKTVMTGAAILGITSGTLGTFAVLRKQSLLGDAVSHSALPGIAIAFLITGDRDPAVLLAGAIIAGLISALCMMLIVEYSPVKYDGALAIILSVFFGMGMVLMSIVQKLPNARQAGLNKFLFGRAATLLQEDIWVMAFLGGIALLLMFIFWKEFKLLSFNPEFGLSLGFSMRAIDILLTSLLVIAIVVGLQTVGVVLMSVMVIAPGVAARQWTDRLEVMAILAGGFGAFSGVVGAIISSEVRRMPTGPIIVLVSFLVVIVSIFIAPRRGMIYRIIQQRKNNEEIKLGQVLINCYELNQKTESITLKKILDKIQFISERNLKMKIRKLEEQGYMKNCKEGWKVTYKGINRAKKIQMYLGGEVDD